MCATRPKDSNACEVFRVGATYEEDKEGAMCGCDVVEWDSQRKQCGRDGSR